MDATVETGSSTLELSNVIRALRLELAASRSERQPGEMELQLEHVQIDVSVEVTHAAGARGGIRFHVVEAGGSRTRSDTAVQRIKLTLVPLGDTGVSEAGEPT